MAAMSACLALTLSACAGSGDKQGFVNRTLPPPPEDVVVCFDELTPAPRAGAMNNAEVMRLVAALRTSEVRLSLCGKRLLSFYEDLK